MKQKKKVQNGRLKKPHFPAPPVLNIFSWKFHVFFASSQWKQAACSYEVSFFSALWFLQNLGKYFIQTNMHTTVALCVSSGNALLTLYYGQFDNHIGCATSMSFASINSINNSRINPWIFFEKYWEWVDLMTFFESTKSPIEI